MIVPESDFSCHCHLHKLCYSAHKKFLYEISLHNWEQWLMFFSRQENQYFQRISIILLAGTGAILNRQISAQYSCEKKRIKITTKQQNTTSAFRRLSATDNKLCMRALLVQNTGLKYMLNAFKKTY